YADLPEITLQQVQHFFEHYKDLEQHKWVKVARWGGPDEAHRLLLEACARARQQRPSAIQHLRARLRPCKTPPPTHSLAPRASRSPDSLLRPDPADRRLTERVGGVDQTGAPVETSVTVERALTIFLNAQEIVTAMTINDYPEYLALGYLLNQNMLAPDDVVTGVDYDDELAVVVVRTERATDYEQKLKKKVQTSGCAQGTVFGDLMEVIETARLPDAELR